MTTDPRRKMVQLLGMLGSAHDGEVVNAARLAQRQLGTMGETWETLLMNGSTPSDAILTQAFQEGYSAGYRKGQAEASARVVRRQSWTQFAKDLNDHHWHLLSEWEQGFCENFVERGWPTPTPKQQAVFERIAEKVGVEIPR